MPGKTEWMKILYLLNNFIISSVNLAYFIHTEEKMEEEGSDINWYTAVKDGQASGSHH